MLRVGLTGNIASGKSTVAAEFVARGAHLIDADVLARKAVEPGSPGLAAIVARWGPGMVTPAGTLDRAALRRIVFRERTELEALNAIVHPEIDRLRQQQLDEARINGLDLVILDIPLLFEKKLDQDVDRVVLVDAPENERFNRLVDMRHIAPDEARAMMSAQMPSADKRVHADYIIENAGSVVDLQHRVGEVWDALRNEARAAPR